MGERRDPNLDPRPGTAATNAALDPSRPDLTASGAAALETRPRADADTESPAADKARGVRSPASPTDLPDRETELRSIWRHFRKHRPGLWGLGVLAVLYVVAIFADFIAPYHFDNQARALSYAPPNLRFSDQSGSSLRPFVHPLKIDLDENFNEIRNEDTSVRLYVRFLVRGEEHDLLGVIPTRLRLVGVDPVSPELQARGYHARMYLMGADISGRDLFSRVCYGARVSMTIGLVGCVFVLLIGLAVGGSMGYFGGRTDDLLYSFSQMVLLLPGFYLLLMLRFTFPSNMKSEQVYFAVILILSLVGWPSLAMVIRGMVKSLRAMDFVQAARAVGLGHGRIIGRHVLPNCAGYIIVTATLRIPGYIIGEAALSVLGLGITEPTPSWGNMLEKARDIVELNQHPWVLWPGVFIFLAVMAFNLVGDGLRDAVDPKRVKV